MKIGRSIDEQTDSSPYPVWRRSQFWGRRRAEGWRCTEEAPPPAGTHWLDPRHRYAPQTSDQSHAGLVAWLAAALLPPPAGQSQQFFCIKSGFTIQLCLTLQDCYMLMLYDNVVMMFFVIWCLRYIICEKSGTNRSMSASYVLACISSHYHIAFITKVKQNCIRKRLWSHN